MEKSKTEKNSLAPIIGLVTISFGYLLFVFSSLQYKNTTWFYYLIISRAILLTMALTLAAIIYKKNKPLSHIQTLYYMLCFAVQASHGIFEGEKSIDFYSYIGIFYLVVAISHFDKWDIWMTRRVPVLMMFFIAPLFFKSHHYFLSLGAFVDSFSLPVAGFILGNIIAHLNSSKFQTEESNQNSINYFELNTKKIYS